MFSRLFAMDVIHTIYVFLDQIFVKIADGIVWLVNWVFLFFGAAGGAPESLLFVVLLVMKVGTIAVVFPVIFALTTWAERKLLGRIQNRIGPNRVGPVGLFQPIADGIKTLTKEDIVPARADRFVHTLAPILALLPAFAVIAVLPMGRNMTPADLNIGVFFFFAAGSLSEMAIFLAGWSSHNKYSLLGGMRGLAQMISYEIPFVLSALTVVMVVGTLSTTSIVEAQTMHWYLDDPEGLSGMVSRVVYHVANNTLGWFIFQPWGFFGFIIFFIAALAELNRSPFDIPEAESEIIAGHHTEYSGFKFALFSMAEYVSMIAVCGLGVTLFLGGWNGPMPVPGWAWFFLKVFFLMFLMIWVRGTMPRLRVDQLMGFAWKFLLPLSLANVLAAGLWHHIPSRFAGWVVSAALMGAAYHWLSRFVTGGTLGKREYRYAA